MVLLLLLLPLGSYIGLPNWLTIILTSAGVIWAILKWRSGYWKRKNVESFPIVSYVGGNIEKPFKPEIHVPEQFGNIYKKAKQAGHHYFGLYSLLLKPELLIIDLKLLKKILVKDFQHFVDRGFYYNEKDDPLGVHLFAIGGQKWKNLRVKMTPTFTAGKMRQMFQVVANCGTILTNTVTNSMKNGGPVDIKNILGCYSTDIICSCAFGLESNTSNDPDSLFRQYGRKFFEDFSFSRRVSNIIGFTFPTVGRLLGVRQVQKDVSDFFIKVVDDTINYRKKNNYIRNDFMQLMIEMQKEDPTFTLDVVAAQCFIFFLAGFETSSTTMTFALYELASNHQIQDKVRQEINETLQKHDGQISYDSIMEMKYLHQVIEGT